MVVLDATIVNVALPHIQAALGFSGSNLEWVVNAYALAFGGLLLLGGRSGDLLGRRRVFIAGIALFSLVSLPGRLGVQRAGHRRGLPADGRWDHGRLRGRVAAGSPGGRPGHCCWRAA